ncbi:MAG TPA: MOSC domain-containing protein [Chromatiaceae bacterium]|nr:MOSC domain-containing protein [Chromatiaceae bacterium]
MVLNDLYRYPVKSSRGESLTSVQVSVRGLLHDRHWMLVNDAGRFLTQRELPQMVLIRPRVVASGLKLSAPGMSDLEAQPDSEEELTVQIWRDQCTARVMSLAADQWLSEFLGVSCRLVYLPREQTRQVDQDYATSTDEVGFADGFPFLLISRASLDDLNRRMGLTLPMERFRPNLVVEGSEAYAEDNWKRIRIGELEFRVVKPCSRCVIPTINPETGERTGNEPLKTLMRYRKQGNSVYFGQNLIHDGQGRLETGMPVEILE